MPTTKATDFPTDPLSRDASQRPRQDDAGASLSAATAVVQQDGGEIKTILSKEEHPREDTVLPRACESRQSSGERRRQYLPRACESGQSEEGGGVDVTAPQDLSWPNCSGSDGDNDQREVATRDNEARKPDMTVGGSRGPRNASEGRGSGRVAKGRWVVTMMVPGRKLWGSSPAVLSQYKRFRRSSQQPKIARDQVKSHVGPNLVKDLPQGKEGTMSILYYTSFVSVH